MSPVGKTTLIAPSLIQTSTDQSSQAQAENLVGRAVLKDHARRITIIQQGQTQTGVYEGEGSSMDVTLVGVTDEVAMKTIEVLTNKQTEADVCRQAIEKLNEYSSRQFDRVQTTIHGLQIHRKKLLEQIDQSVAPAKFLLITGPKGIGKSALVKIYLENQRCPWFAFKGEDLSQHASLEAFLNYHGLRLDGKMLERFDQEEKKIIYIDSTQEIFRKAGAFFDLVNLFRKKNWTIFLSSNKGQTEWIKENIEGISNKEIETIEVPLIGEEDQEEEEQAKDSKPPKQNDVLRPFLDKYPILSCIRWDRLFQPYYTDLFKHPLYLKFFCEEMAKLSNPKQHFNSAKTLKNFEGKIWRKVVCSEASEAGISELRQRLMIDITIKKVLGDSVTSILRTADPTTLNAISFLKKDQLLDDKGNITNKVFIELSLKMYFGEIVQDWLLGRELDFLSDDKLGGIANFDLIFSDFLIAWFDDVDPFDIDPLAEFLKKNHSNYEGFIACFFHRLLRTGKMQEVDKMLAAIPDLANLPVFMDGCRIQFPINVAIDTLDISLIELLLQHGAKLCSSLETSATNQQKTTKRPRDLANHYYQGQEYFCLIPLRGAIASAIRFNSPEERIEFLEFLIEKGARLRDDVDSYHAYISILHVAVENYDPKIVSFLLDHGIDPEVYSDIGLSPLGEALENLLHFARKSRNDHASGKDATESFTNMRLSIDIFKQLVKKGGRTTGLMCEGALIRLIRERSYPLARFLLENKFDPEEGDLEGLNAFDYTFYNYDNYRQKDDMEFFSLLQKEYPVFFHKWVLKNMTRS